MEQSGPTQRSAYPFAEVEARWRSERAGGGAEEASAAAGEASARHYLFVWPGLAPGGAGGTDGGDATLARRWVLADTLARFLRHKDLNPFFPAAVDSLAPEVALEAAAGPVSLRHAAGAHAGRVKALARALGTGFTASFVDTADPEYYRFTQWLFLQLFLRGLARHTQVRWDFCARCVRRFRFGSFQACPACQGELAPRDVFEWQVDISSYGDRLIGDLERSGLDAGECSAERDLLGRCRGCEVTFPVTRIFSEEYADLTVFTTSIERIFGVTFLLVDPYHPILEHVLDAAYEDDVVRYRERLKKGAEPRISAARTGGFALNPANLRRIPILVSPLARELYSDGVVMGVPAHDVILFELARRLKLGIREVVHNDKAKFDSQSRLEEPWLGDGVLTNSGPFTSMASKVGRDRIISLLSRKGVCRKGTRFRLNALPAASASPWGPPVPIVHCKRCGIVPVPETQLPVELPAAVSDPPRRGEADLKSFLRAACPACGESALRDTQTLLPWLNTAWSFIRLALPELSGAVEGFRGLNAPADAPPSAAVSSKSSAAGAPARAEEADDSAVVSGVAARAVDSASDSISTGNVLPEDVDIFDVSTSSGPESLAGSPAEKGDDGGDDGSHVASADGPASSAHDAEGASSGGADRSASEDDSTPSMLAASPEPDDDSLREAPPGRTVATARQPSRREEDVGDEKKTGRELEPDEDEDEDEEAVLLTAALAKLSKLRPFSAPALSALFPIGSAFGASHLGPKDLIAVRFLAKFLSDAGQIPVSEPFARYRRVAAVQSFGAVKGSEPAGGHSPAGCMDILERCGADALRLHFLFSAPIGRDAPLDLRGVRRMQKFLDRIWHQVNLRREKGRFVSRRMLVNKHFLIHDVTRRLSEWKFHTAVAALMSFIRFLEHPETAPEDMDRGAMRTFVILLSPFSPFLAQELWSRMGETQSLETASWPVASDELIHPPEREYLIYVDGKVRDRMQQPSNLEPEKLESRALGRERIRAIVGSCKVERVVVVPQKLVSIVLAK